MSLDEQQARQQSPCLQTLVLAHGTFDKIPPKAWQTFNAEMAEWKAKVRYGELGYVVDRLVAKTRQWSR